MFAIIYISRKITAKINILEKIKMNEVKEILHYLVSEVDEIIKRLDKLSQDKNTKENVPTFDDFAQYYFENFRWRKVTAGTRYRDVNRYNRYILSTVGTQKISEVTPKDCQNVIDDLANKPKTSHEVFGLLNTIFKAAIKHGLLTNNPCDMVLILPYEKTHGKALTIDEEQQLLSATSGTAYQKMFAVALYTGLRPNEYATAKIEGEFIVARNSKQHDKKEHYKRIPITPMLVPYLIEDEPLHFYYISRVREKFKTILPQHKLYDLRTTFYTRCVEYGVSEIARKLFVGHSLGGLANTYTDVSDEYLIKEAQKLVY